MGGAIGDGARRVDPGAGQPHRLEAVGRQQPVARSGCTFSPISTMSRSSERISVFLFALFLLALFVGLAFAAGYGLGRILL